MEPESYGPREPGDPLEPARLTVCPGCELDFAVPMDGAECDEHTWLIVLRCGACGLRYDRRASDEEIDRLCDEIDAGLDRLATHAERLDRERLGDQVEIFVAALAHDLISADDFAG
jgi:hypothetical protein